MPPQIAAIAFTIGILGLFRLDRSESRTSMALWIPTVWMALGASRPLSVWLSVAPPPDSDLYVEGSPIDRAVFLALLVIGVLVLASRHIPYRQLVRQNITIAVFLAYCAVSILWSDFPGVAFKRWIKALGDFVMLLIIFTDAEPIEAVKRLLARLAFFLVPISVLFIKYYPDLGRGYDRWTWLPVWTGIATNKNDLGMICMIFGLASLWRVLLAIRDRHTGLAKRPLIAHGFVLVMVLWLILQANCMTTLGCFTLAGALMIAVFLVIRTRTQLHLGFAVVLGIAIFALFLDPGGDLVKQLGRDPTLTGRTELWTVLPQFSPNSVLGAGYQSFWMGDRLAKIRHMFEGNPLMEAHNGYLEVFLNLGWVGAVLLGCVLISGYRKVTMAVRDGDDLGTLKLAYFTAAVIYNFTEAAFKELNLVWICLLLAMLTVPTEFALEPSPHVEIDAADSFADEWQPTEGVVNV